MTRRLHPCVRAHALMSACILIGCLAAPPAQAGSLGRIFFTPQERAELERAHANNGAAEDNPSALVVNGIVQRQGGGRTVWINGVAQNAGSSDEHNPESLPVAVPGNSKTVKVKVGQRLLLEQPGRQQAPHPVR